MFRRYPKVSSDINLKVIKLEYNVPLELFAVRQERIETRKPPTPKKRARLKIPEIRLTEKSSGKPLGELIEELLADIYRPREAADSERCTSVSMVSECVDMGMITKTDLLPFSEGDLRCMIVQLKRRIQQYSSLLVKRLNQRETRHRRNAKLCEIVTTILQEYYQLGLLGEGDMRFTVSPKGGACGWAEWLKAMKLVARLPNGIPPDFRKKLWLTLAEQHLKVKGVDWSKAEKTCFSEWTNPDDTELGVQIVKDLHRTGCSLFCGTEGRENQAVLKRVLLAYARWNKAVGYCQGFNMLAALILEVMDRSESDSLKVMIYLIEAVLPEGYFANNLRGLSVDMAVFRDLLKLRLPRLSAHLEKLQKGTGDGSCYEPPLTNVFTMQWFLTLFCNCLPRNTVLRVWDLVFLEGDEVLLTTALAIWDTLQDRILQVDSADEFYSTMGELARQTLEAPPARSEALLARAAQLGPVPELPRLRDKHRYNITPWAHSVQSAAKKGLRLFYSEDETDSSDESDKLAITTAYGLQNSGRGRGALVAAGVFGHPDREKLALDISALKQQYARLRERQRQAHIILAAACARQPSVSVTSGSGPISVNHLLLGKSAIVSRGRRLGPPQGAIPPSRTKVSKSVPKAQPVSQNKNETLSWQDENQKKSLIRRDSIKWKDIKGSPKEGQSDEEGEDEEGKIVPECEANEIVQSAMRSRRRSESSSYSECSESSTSTSLCDEPNRLSDFDSEPPSCSDNFPAMDDPVIDVDEAQQQENNAQFGTYVQEFEDLLDKTNYDDLDPKTDNVAVDPTHAAETSLTISPECSPNDGVAFTRESFSDVDKQETEHKLYEYSFDEHCSIDFPRDEKYLSDTDAFNDNDYKDEPQGTLEEYSSDKSLDSIRQEQYQPYTTDAKSYAENNSEECRKESRNEYIVSPRENTYQKYLIKKETCNEDDNKMEDTKEYSFDEYIYSTPKDNLHTYLNETDEGTKIDTEEKTQKEYCFEKYIDSPHKESFRSDETPHNKSSIEEENQDTPEVYTFDKPMNSPYEGSLKTYLKDEETYVESSIKDEPQDTPKAYAFDKSLDSPRSESFQTKLKDQVAYAKRSIKQETQDTQNVYTFDKSTDIHLKESHENYVKHTDNEESQESQEAHTTNKIIESVPESPITSYLNHDISSETILTDFHVTSPHVGSKKSLGEFNDLPENKQFENISNKVICDDSPVIQESSNSITNRENSFDKYVDSIKGKPWRSYLEEFRKADDASKSGSPPPYSSDTKMPDRTDGISMMEEAKKAIEEDLEYIPQSLRNSEEQRNIEYNDEYRANSNDRSISSSISSSMSPVLRCLTGLAEESPSYMCYKSPSRADSATGIELEQDEKPIVFMIDKYFEHSPEFFGARKAGGYISSDDDDEHLGLKRRKSSAASVKLLADSNAKKAWTDTYVTDIESFEKIIQDEIDRSKEDIDGDGDDDVSPYKAHVSLIATNQPISTDVKNELKYGYMTDLDQKQLSPSVPSPSDKSMDFTRSNILEKTKSEELPSDQKRSFSILDDEIEAIRTQSGRRNSERALKIIQENSKILHRILVNQVNKTARRDCFKEESYDTSTETLNQDRELRLIEYRNQKSLASPRSASLDENHQRKSKALSLLPDFKPFEFELKSPNRRKENTISEEVKSPNEPTKTPTTIRDDDANKTDSFGWENKGFAANQRLSYYNSQCSYESKFDMGQQKDEPPEQDKEKTSNTESWKTENNNSISESYNVVSPFKFTYRSSEHSFAARHKNADPVSKVTECSPMDTTTRQESFRYETSQSSDLCFVSSSMSFSFDPSVDDQPSSKQQTFNSSDTLCQLTSLDQVSTPISPKIMTYPSAKDIATSQRELSLELDKFKVTSEESSDLVSASFSSMKTPTSPVTSSYDKSHSLKSPEKAFNPFPVKTSYRQPRELGLRLGLYKDPLKSPSK